MKTMLTVGAVLAVFGAISLMAADPSKRQEVPPSSLTLLSYKCGGSESGRAMATFDLIGDSADTGSAIAVFRLVSVRNAAGMLSSVRKAVPVSEVVWPVTITDAEETGVLATAVFSNAGTAGAIDVTIETVDG